MFFHTANIRPTKRYNKFFTRMNHYGEGVHATFGKHPKTGKQQLQKIEFDSAMHTVQAANDFLFKMGQIKTKVVAGANIPDQFEIESTSANLEILAADPVEGEEVEPLRNFRMVAYTGGPMVTSTIPAPLIVSYAGLDMQAGKKLPILMDHKTTQRVGHSMSMKVEANELHASGILSAATKFTKEIIESSDNGYPWQASIGATIIKAHFLDKKGSEVVNGQTVKGPLLVVDKAQLREVSFVSIGADGDTSAVAASAAIQEDMKMGFNQWLKAKGFDKDTLAAEALASLEAMYNQEVGGSSEEDTSKKEEVVAGAENIDVNGTVSDAIKAERTRVSEIRAACGTEFPEIQAQAESEGWDVAQTNQKVLKAMRENRPNINTGIGAPEKGSLKVVEAAFGMRCGLDEKELVEEHGEEVVAAAYKDRSISIRDVMAAAMQSEGKMVPRSMNNDFIRAALSTVSLPGILSNTANKRMLKAYSLQNITATQVCSQGDLADFKQSDRYRLNELGSFDEVGATGEIKHGTLGEETATNQLSTYGKMITLSRAMIINDDLSALTKIPAAMAARAAQKIDELFYTRLLSNPSSLFSSGNKNYQDGTNTALSVSSMDAAMQLFKDQTNADGLPINVSPRHLIVPTALEFTARQILTSSTLTAFGDTDTTNVLTANPMTGQNLNLVVSPYLNSQGLTSSSSLGWYLFGDPSTVDTFEIGYLRGARTPTLEQVDLPSDMLGMGWRIYFDLGIREQDHRGMVFSKGEA